MQTAARALADNVTTPLEQAFMKVGIDSAWKAGLFVTGVTAAGLWYAKPALSFDKRTGQPRPWIFFYNPNDKEGAPPTYIPFWLGAALTGYVFSLVI